MDGKRPTRRIYPIVLRSVIRIGQGSLTSSASIEESRGIWFVWVGDKESGVTGGVQEENIEIVKMQKMIEKECIHIHSLLYFIWLVVGLISFGHCIYLIDWLDCVVD